MHDLEIRGAGEVLGENQRGEMQEIGFTSTRRCSTPRCVRCAREASRTCWRRSPPSPRSTCTCPRCCRRITCSDVHERLSLYKRLASCDDEDDLIRLQEELVDRFGKLPEAGKALIETHRLRLLAEPLGVKKIDASVDAIVIAFVPEPSFDTAKLIALMQQSRTMRLAGPTRLRIDEKTATLEARLTRLREVFRALR